MNEEQIRALAQIFEQNIGHVTAYAYAKATGKIPEDMTQDEFGEILADYINVEQRAAQAADRAEAALDEFTSVTAEATTLPEGSSATAEYSEGHLVFGIPKGDTGDGSPHLETSADSIIVHLTKNGYSMEKVTISVSLSAYIGQTKDPITSITGLPTITVDGSRTVSAEFIYDTTGYGGFYYTIPALGRVDLEVLKSLYTVKTAAGKTFSHRLTVAFAKDGAQGEGAPNLRMSTDKLHIMCDSNGVTKMAQRYKVSVLTYSGSNRVYGSTISGLPDINLADGSVISPTKEIEISSDDSIPTSEIGFLYEIPAGVQITDTGIIKEFAVTAKFNTHTETFRPLLTIAIVKDGAQGIQGIQGEKGDKGDTGATPEFAIGTVETLDPSEQATATISGTAENPVLNLGIPKGDTGEVSQEQFDEALALKADAIGNYPDLAVGTAGQIISDKCVTDSVPYHFRATGGTGADREYVDAIVGGTVNWNQLADFSAVNIPSASNGISYAYTDGTSVKITGTATAVEQRTGWFGLSELRNLPLSRFGHKVLIDTRIVSGSFDGNINYGIGSSAVRPIETPYIGPLTNNNTNQIRFQHQITSGTVCNDLILSFNVYDLTAMFGSTIADYIYSLEQSTAGAGVAWFRKLFPNDYYEYDTGTLKSVDGVSAHKMVGFNQWDEEWEAGGINTNNGLAVSSNVAIRSKNYNKILGNTTYYINTPYGSTVIFFYDEQKKYISYLNVRNRQLTTPEDAFFFKVRVGADMAPQITYNHDICINLSDPAKNGTYEPYKAHSYPLDSTLTLRGLFKLDANNKLYADGDTYDADGTVTRRYGVVDLGTLNWSYNSGNNRFDSYFRDASLTPQAAIVANAIASKYITVSFSELYADTTLDKCLAFDKNNLRIRDMSYTDAAAFKAAMSGVMLVYELATPVIEEADPYQHLQQCDPYGTEEFVSTGIIPVGHDTRYPENLRAKIEGLPTDFSTLIASTEKTTTASKNYAVGSYLIYDNILYKVTSAIASGGAITVGTNVTATTIMAEIAALQ